MDIKENVSLAGYSTMRLGGKARYLAEVHSGEEVAELVDWAKERQLPIRMVGGGSNIIWRDEGFPGLIMVNKIMGKEVISEDESSATILLKGGEEWDTAVEWTVNQNLHGLEFLSLIPGSVGAAPVQNIGAYGAELSNVLKRVGVYDTVQGSFESLPASDCSFSYRNSRFKSQEPGRFLILDIVIVLAKTVPQPPFYDALEKYFKEHSISEFTPESVRQAVIAIRSSKLPDPKHVANNGSFFTNPFITGAHFEELKKKYPDIK